MNAPHSHADGPHRHPDYWSDKHFGEKIAENLSHTPTLTETK